MTTTPAMTTLTESFDYAVEELDYLLGKVCRNHPILTLTYCYPSGVPREEDKRWKVWDIANGWAQMLPPVRYGVAIRFSVAFLQKHPETVLDATFGPYATTSGEETSRGGGPPAPPTPPPLTEAHHFALAYDRLVELLRKDKGYSVRVPDNVIPLPVRGDVA